MNFVGINSPTMLNGKFYFQVVSDIAQTYTKDIISTLMLFFTIKLS